MWLFGENVETKPSDSFEKELLYEEYTEIKDKRVGEERKSPM